ncbi:MULTISPECIES: glutathione S-transferase family protein [Cyanophyceae]|uniref:glutathione S-transferase family protein n=1 Tax=Cyanophyceae TaxID=3028117 RepID=UPI001685DA7A|nr:glutathione S-transferase family protein [Trichocoleus sp. FACHB-69]MBD1932273.1 glutathione S-transferase family protein [Trichocoleus sp. FACHB-69]
MTHSKNQALTSNGSDRVWESTIINEYLEEIFPEAPLMPRDRGERAIALLSLFQSPRHQGQYSVKVTNKYSTGQKLKLKAEFTIKFK